jgi:hypothetical protein
MCRVDENVQVVGLLVDSDKRSKISCLVNALNLFDKEKLSVIPREDARKEMYFGSLGISSVAHINCSPMTPP